MPTPQPIDLSLYVTAPRLSVPSAVALGIALLSAAPKPAPAAVRRAAMRIRDTVVGLQQAWRGQLAATQADLLSPREADLRVDRAVRSLSMRLESLAILPTDASPDVERAQQLLARLFADGLRFLSLPYTQQWAYCDRLLATLDDDDELADDVARIVGEVVLDELRAAQVAYGEALGVTLPKESVEVVPLAAPLDAVRSAIVAYSLQIIAMQSDDPARLSVARAALAPIDALRAAQTTPSRRPNEAPAAPVDEAAAPDEGEPTVTPDTPVPAVETLATGT